MALKAARSLIFNFLDANKEVDKPLFDMREYDFQLSVIIDRKVAKDKDFTAVFFNESSVSPIGIGSRGSYSNDRATGMFSLYFGVPKQVMNGKKSYERIDDLQDYWGKVLNRRRIGKALITDWTTLNETQYDGITKRSHLQTGAMTFNYYIDVSA